MRRRQISGIALKSAALVAILNCPWVLRAQGKSVATDLDKLAAQADQARVANQLKEASGLYLRVLSSRPGWAEGWWHLGTLLYDADQYGDAAEAFRKAAGLRPEVGTTWVMLGLCEYKLGQDNAALKHIQHGRQLGTSADPQFRQVMLYHEGLLLLGKGEFEKAQETLALLARGDVQGEDARMALGLSVLRLTPAGLSRDDSNLRQVVLHAGYAEELAARGKFTEAMQEYERLTAEFPKQLNVHYAFGRFLIASGNPDPERAVTSFQREIENHPEHVLARLGIASVKASTDPAGGLPYAEQAVKLNPHMPLGHYLLGSLLLHADQSGRAIRELETAQRLAPNEPRVYFALGRAYARANRKKDAARARATFKRLTDAAQRRAKDGATGDAARSTKKSLP
jgi:predicted Zn-dependent protease